MDDGLILVLDVGKTSAKLIATETVTGAVIWRAERPAPPPSRELDAPGIRAWLRASLGTMPGRERVRAIVPVAHGAAAAFLGADGTLLTLPDYEDPAHNAYDVEYETLRDPFALTLSPPLPGGQNLGRQIHALVRSRPGLFAQVRHVLPYPQYWAYRLGGVMASEVTSLGAHTDLWLPREGRFSPMAVSQGWADLFPPRRAAGDVLGPVRPKLAAELGLDPACRVLCGLHDSNASYLCHRAHCAEPFAVVSSGTWTVAMSGAADLARLDPARDMLANVDALGTPVGTARFMGGREFAAIAGPDPADPTAEAVAEVVAAGTMALPAFAAAGPFPSVEGRFTGQPPRSAAARASLATLYVALMLDTVLDLMGVEGTVIVDGPLAANAAFAPLLAALRPGAAVFATGRRAGTLGGARWLVRGAAEPAPEMRPAAPLVVPGLAAYREVWRCTAEGALKRNALEAPSSWWPAGLLGQAGPGSRTG